MSRWFGIGRELKVKKDGSVLPMAAAGILVVMALIGGGVDMARAYKAQSRLQAACDAAVLAGRRTVTTDGFSEVAEGQANAYFAANFDDGQQGTRETEFDVNSPDEGLTVQATASSAIPAVIMQIFGFDQIPISVECTASMGVGNSDITFVLDTTGSMDWIATADWQDPGPGETSRMEDLQAAMKNFYDTVDEAMSSSNARVRYAMVPYSSSVNVGQLLIDEDPDYLVDTMDIQSRAWMRWGTATIISGPTAGAPVSASPGSWAQMTPTSSYRSSSSSGCNALSPTTATAWANNGSPSSPTPTYVVDSSNGKKISTSLSIQNQRRTNYSCIRSGSYYYKNWRYEYQNITTQTISEQSPVYEYGNASATVDGLMYRQVQFDVSGYKNFETVRTLTGRTGSGVPGTPAWVTSAVWAGCVEERQTVSDDSFTFVPGDGITPSAALDLNIDSAPGTDDTTKWAPLWPEVGYYRSSATANFALYAGSTRQASAACPVAAELLKEWGDEDSDGTPDFYDYVDGLTPNGGTYHDIGLIWGARLSSPDGIWGDLVGEEPDNGSTVSRHLVFMTDGILDPNPNSHTSYGVEVNDHRVTDDGSESQQEARHRLRFLAICEAIKAKGIRLWVIAFGPVGLNADLQVCASDSDNNPATNDSAFAASNASQLNEKFQEIARQVGELRITQ